MTFGAPLFLFGTAGALLIAALLVVAGLRAARARTTFGDAKRIEALVTYEAATRRAWKGVLLVAATALAFFAAARPQYGKGTRLVPATNVDVILVLDLSKSMYAKDVEPSRIFRAKAELTRLVKDLPGVRFGAVAFAGEPMGFPISADGTAVAQFLRQLEPNPWDDVHLRFPVDRVVKGIVRNLTAYGAFVELEDGIDGMIHVSDMSWTRKINHPSDQLKKGQEIEAKVLEIDKINQRISLGLKQLSDDPWRSIEERFKIGDTVTGVVSKIASFGAFVQLKEDIDGLVHISQISDERVEKVKDALKVGDEVTARVIKVDRAERRIGLSIKAANYTLEQIEAERQVLDSIKPGEDLVTMGSAFDKLEEEYRPGQK